MASPDLLSQVADRICADRAAGVSIVAVVSALKGETDRLLQLAQAHGTTASRESDLLLATGEHVTAALLALSLQFKGIPAVALTGAQIPIRTTAAFGQAQIEFVAPQKIRKHFSQGQVVVVAGFQGVTESGETTTLGRGGSDLTAVALAAALEAERCEIFKDVEGVYTADPTICGDARRISRLSYDEMLELATLGSKVLQARSVQLAKRYMVPVHVKCFSKAGPGTWIEQEESNMEGTIVSAISCDRREGQISVRRLPDPVTSTSKLFEALASSDIVVDVIVQDRNQDGLTNVTFTVPRESFAAALAVAEQLAKSFGGVQVLSHERVAKVSAVGLGMRTHSGVAARLLRTLANEKIEVMAISTSDIKISCVIDDRYGELAVRSLHDEFGLAKEPN